MNMRVLRQIQDGVERYLRWDIAIRVLADIVIVVSSLFVGFSLTLIASPFPAPAPVRMSEGVWEALALVARAAPVLVPMVIGISFIRGVYTRTRFYRAASKVPLLVQAISLSYLILWLLSTRFPDVLPLSTTGLVYAWVLTVLASIAARFWSSLWAQLLVRDRLMATPPAQPRSSSLHSVLVIGGAGYIGSVLCRQILERGYRVRVLDALLYGDHAVRDLIGGDRFELIEGDSRDIVSLVTAVRGVDAVIHLGEIVGDPACALDEEVTLEVNLAATRMVAEVAKGFGVQRFVYASSCSVYGATDDVVDEQSELHPVSLYARTKIDAERVLLGLRSRSFRPVIVRFATVFGLSPRARFDLVVNTLAARAAVDGHIMVYGGAQWRPFVHVADVARALILCLEKPIDLVDGHIFNVGADTQNYTILQIAELVRSVLPETQVQIIPATDDQRDYRVSFAKIRQELGFEPKLTVEQGIREIIDAIVNGSMASYGDPRYDNAMSLRMAYASRRVRAIHTPPLYELRQDGRSPVGGHVVHGDIVLTRKPSDSLLSDPASTPTDEPAYLAVEGSEPSPVARPAR